MNETVLAMLNDRLDRMENKLDALISFRYRVIGIATTCGAIAGFAIELAMRFI